MKTALRASRRSTVSQRLKRAIPTVAEKVRAATLAANPVAYWPCDDTSTVCDDAVGSRDLTHSVAPVSDPMFGKVASAKTSGTPTVFSWMAAGGWFYFPQPFKASNAYVGFMCQGYQSQNLAGGNNLTGTFANELLLLGANSGNAFRAWDSATDVIPAGWHHLFTSYRASLGRWELMLDGIARSNGAFSTIASSLTSNGAAVYLGSYDGTNGLISTQNIKMAHLAYFGAEVTDAQIAAIVAAGPTLNYTGAAQTLVVPAGAKSMTVDMYGGGGGKGGTATGGAGGYGARTRAVVAVTGGETLQFNVGGKGGDGGAGSDVAGGAAGWNGGAAGSANGGNSGAGSGGGGGGATDIRRGAFALADRILVAGAGAGGGSGRSGVAGGAGGHANGSAGTAGSTTGGGGAGTTSAGGAAGTGPGVGVVGTIGAGGASGGPFGGGGAGGRWGGGGGGGTNDSFAGSGGGGGGGASYAEPGTSSVTLDGGAATGASAPGCIQVTFSTAVAPQTYYFAYTGAAQTVVVPAGLTSMTVDLYAAAGGPGGASGPGSLGGRLQATLPVTPAETLQVNVGGAGMRQGVGAGGGYPGAGGWNGGGGYPGTGTSANDGGSGGGATDVRRGGTALANRYAVAGGGGGGRAGTTAANVAGGGGTTGGAGGGASPGGGGTPSAGGAGGGGAIRAGTAGALGVGGICAGGTSDPTPLAGSGGGGYYGGGGGGQDSGSAGSGGGSGSSYTDPAATGVTHTQGTNGGHGSAVITFNP